MIDNYNTGELIAILFISTCFLFALCYILTQEKEETDYFKTWEE